MSLFPKVGRTQPALRIGWWIMIALLVIGVLTHLFPVYFMLVTSITPAIDIMTSGTPNFWPAHPTLAPWKLVFQWAAQNGAGALIEGAASEPFWVYFWNSLFITVITLAISIPITALAAYATSKLLRGPLARWSFLFFIGTVMVPSAVMILPQLFMVVNFPFALPGASIPNMPGSYDPYPAVNMFNTPWAIIVPAIFNGYNYLIFKGYFDTIPNSVLQAARVDGGSELNIFRRIVLPMSIPVFSVIMWIQFQAVWDSYLWPSLVIADNNRATTAIAVYNVMHDFTTSGVTERASAFSTLGAMRNALGEGLSWNGLMVLGLLQTLPIFVMFIFCREYLLKAVRIQGIK